MLTIVDSSVLHYYRIDVWEVFILLSRLNDDWGWGRSHRTGESGLIPLMIMEDVVSEGEILERK